MLSSTRSFAEFWYYIETMIRVKIAIKNRTTKIRMVKSPLSTSEVVACYEKYSNESHVSDGQEFSAI